MASQFKTYLRLSTYFWKYRTRVLGGLLSVAIISGADTASAFLVARFLWVLEQIGLAVQAGKEIFIEIPLSLFKTEFYRIVIRGYDESFRIVIYFAIATILIIAVKAIFVYTREYLMSSVQHKILMKFRTDLFDTVVMLPVGYFDREKTGKIMSRITNDVNNLEQSLSLIVEILQNVVYSAVFATALFLTNWQLTLFTIVVFGISGVISRKFGDAIRKFSRSLTDTVADISTFLQEKISSIRTVKSFTREEFEKERFREKAKQNYFYSMKIVRTMAFLSPTNELFNTFVTALLVVFLGFLFVTGSMNFETMFSFLILITFLAKPLKALVEGIARIQKTLVSAGYIFEILDTEKEPVRTGGPFSPSISADVEFRNVSFSYTDGVEALDSVSFKATNGEKIALVGPSGAGKTTLINLIPRFYKLSAGTILIGGVDTAAMGLNELRSMIAIVPQDVMLFSGTIADNIRYGRLDASDDEIIAAAKAANAHDFIMGLEKSYGTECGERGTQLSGGQRQRIAIARALLRNPKILLLDEATSALDSESEKAVQAALTKLMEGRTTFIIAHRLSTVRECDRILVLNGGKLVEEGTHRTLLKKRRGLYKKLHSIQSLRGELSAV